MNSTRSTVRMLSTVTLCLICGTLAVLWPGWRSVLRAHTYYHEGGCMKGGGTIGTSHAIHDFTLQCNVHEGPNELEVSWGRGNKFKLKRLTSASCIDDPNIQPKSASARFDTYDGAGTGLYNGAPASIEWTFTDAGKGANDFADIVIKDSKGNVLSLSGTLSKGDQQARRDDCDEGQDEDDDDHHGDHDDHDGDHKGDHDDDHKGDHDGHHDDDHKGDHKGH